MPRSLPSRRATARHLVAAGTVIATATAGVLVVIPAAAAASPDVVISEVYGGGGNSGATLTNDFIELYNTGDTAVSLDDWSVQYASSGGDSWQVTLLAGSIEPGEHYLVQEAEGAGGTTPLPTPDAIGTIAMSGSAGKVALVTSPSSLTDTCDYDEATPEPPCSQVETVYDFVGYGGANDFEGTGPAPGLANETSASRDADGTDTDDNAADFTEIEPPTPTNSAGETPPPPPPPLPCDGATPVPATITEIQGDEHLSPMDGDCVVTSGVVTATKFDGYWVQDPTGDDNPASSEGIYVFTSSSGEQPAVASVVDVTGFVDEFRPGSDGLAITELTDSEYVVTSTGAPLPAPVLIGPGGVFPPTQTVDDDSQTRIDIEVEGTFDPEGDAIDFYEQYEGMLVSLDRPQVVGPTNNFGEVALVPRGPKDAIRTDKGGVVYGGYDLPNTTRILADDEIIFQQMPDANTGDSLESVVSGPLWYSFNNFKLQLTEVPTVIDGGETRDVAKDAKPKQLAVAAFNVENLSPNDDQSKFDALAEIVVENLRSPDVLALEEIQDNSGAENDGVVAADETLDQLVAAIAAAGGPTYAYTQIDPEDLQDGGQPGGNIRVGFLYDTSRGLEFNQRGMGDATTPTEVTTDEDGEIALTLSPGRVNPLDPAWEDTRKPLAAEFTWRGEKLFVVANHFSSKGGDEPLFGRFQPPTRESEDARHLQAASVNEFVDELLAVDSDANIVVAGDINDFEFSETIDILGDDGAVLADLIQYKSERKRYTYIFEGNSQVLDHILVGPSFTPVEPVSGEKPVFPRAQYQVVNVNSDFADQVSDHDPQVVKLKFGSGQP